MNEPVKAVVEGIGGRTKALLDAWERVRASGLFRATALAVAVSIFIGTAVLAIATKQSLKDFPSGLDVIHEGTVKPVVLARDGTRLSVTLQNAWNTTDVVPLQEMPEFLKRSFVLSEDKHFYEHHGVDWSARIAAL